MKLHALLAAAVLPLAATAQTHHVDTPERVTRAVAVYEWTGDLKKPDAARLVPVTLFLDGRMQNAATYLAHPVPLALSIGTLYSVEKAGDPFGTLDLNLARNLASRQADSEPTAGNWYGYGNFAPPAPPKPRAPAKASVNLATVNSSDDDNRPHFVLPRSTATDQASPAPKSTPSAPEDSDRPTLRRTPSATTDTTPDTDPDRPTLAHRGDDTDAKPKKQKKEKPGGYVTGPNRSLNDDPDRPTIRRGLTPADTVPPLTGIPAELHQAVAVSDPGIPNTHLFTREWDGADDRATTLTALQKLALPRLRDYLRASGLNTAPIMPPSRTHPTSHAIRVIPPAPIAFTNEQLYGYQLSYGGLPTFVYTAQASAPAPSGPALYITLVAQRLATGELQVSLASVTDAAHLNRTPWLRFIDVVDVDGSHRASLLFELRAEHSRQFALYRLISATAEQTFLTNILE